MAAGRKSPWSCCLLWGEMQVGCFQMWMQTVSSISKKEGLCVQRVIDTYFTLSQLLQCYSFYLILCRERRSYLDNLSMLLMKNSIDKNQGWEGTCILGCFFWALAEEELVLSQWLCCLRAALT